MVLSSRFERSREASRSSRLRREGTVASPEMTSPYVKDVEIALDPEEQRSGKHSRLACLSRGTASRESRGSVHGCCFLSAHI